MVVQAPTQNPSSPHGLQFMITGNDCNGNVFPTKNVQNSLTLICNCAKFITCQPSCLYNSGTAEFRHYESS